MTGPAAGDLLLVLNAGSSSITLAVFDRDLTERLSVIADGVGGSGRLKLGDVETVRALPRLAREDAITGKQDLLRKTSGLHGLTARFSDMRALKEAATAEAASACMPRARASRHGSSRRKRST